MESLKSFINDENSELFFIDPKLAEIPTITLPDLYSYYVIPEKIFKTIVKDVKNSYYYNHIDNDISFSPIIRKNEKMWTKITLASYVEHLVKKKVKIMF